MCDVHAEIQSGIVSDGVYTLKNKATGQYLDIQYDSPNEEMLIQQYAYNSVPSSDSERSGLFKFKHYANDYYVIRTMRNNANTFYRKNDYEVRTFAISPYESNNTFYDCWKVVSAGNGYYYLKAYNYEKYLSTPASGVNSNKYCTTESLAQAGDRAKWELILYTGSTIRGLSFVNSATSVYMESETQYSAYMWTTDITNNGPILWSVHNNTSWSNTCYSTITATGVLQTSTVDETIDVSANPGWATSYYVVVHVMPPLESNIYAIKSNYSGMYMDVRLDSAREEAPIQQYDYGSTPNEESERGGLFKIEWTESGNAYVIRTMTNNANGIAPMSDEYNGLIETDKIDYTFSGIWYITRESDNSIIIKPSNTSLYAIASPNTNSSGVAGGDNSLLRMDSVSSEKAKWSFIQPEGMNAFSGVHSYYSMKHIMEMGSTISISPSEISYNYFYCTEPFINTPGNIIDYSIMNPSGVSSNIAYVNEASIVGKQNKAGMVSVRVSYSNNDFQTLSTPINIYIKPTNNQFFVLLNRKTSIGVLQSGGTSVSKAIFSFDDTQIWRRVDAGNGYFYIVNMDGRYLTAPSSLSVGSQILLQTNQLSGQSANRQKWKFDYSPYGINGYVVKSASNNSLCLKINGSGTLVLGNYVSDSNLDDEFGVAFLGDEVKYLRTLENFSEIDLSEFLRLLSAHYDSFSFLHMLNHLGTNQNNNDPDSFVNIALDLVENSRVMVFNGHGSWNSITVHEPPQRLLSNTDIYTSSNNHADLSDVDIVIFAGCSTAASPPEGMTGYNITKSAELAGAKVSIGWAVDTINNHNSDWIDTFFYYMFLINPETGELFTAEEAFEEANDSCTNEARNSVMYGTQQNFSFNN